jgi:hypothetical protein
MKNFGHYKVRLNASITQAMRFFLIGKEINKWFGESILVENKKGGVYHLKFKHQDVTFESQTILLEKDFERRIKFDMMTPGLNASSVEVFFMPCTSKTTYCTEIHVVHRDVMEEEQEFLESFWLDKLDALRQYFNEDWVIEDRDLVLSVLKGGL